MHGESRFTSLCFHLGICLGCLMDGRLMAELIASLKDPDGVNPGYVRKLRDRLTEALVESGHEERDLK